MLYSLRPVMLVKDFPSLVESEEVAISEGGRMSVAGSRASRLAEIE